MTTIREAHNKFKELIERQKKVKDAMEAERRYLQQDIRAAGNVLNREIAAILPAIDGDILDQIDEIATRSKAERSFARIAAQMLEEDAAIQMEISTIENKEGDQKILEGKRTDLKTTISKTNATLQSGRNALNALETAQARIINHNNNYERKIAPDTVGEFQQFKFLSYIFNAEYRSGYKALRDYGKKGQSGDILKPDRDFVTDYYKISGLKERIKMQEDSLSSRTRQLSETTCILDKISSLQEKRKGHDQILETVRTAIWQLAVDNESFAAALAATLEKDSAESFILSALKVRNLQKADESLEKQIDGIDQTIAKLEPSRSKLAKGARSAGYKSINIDLGQIEKAVNAQAVMGSYAAVNTNKFRSAVDTYTPPPSSSNDSFLWQNLFLMHILLSTDHSYCHQTIGIDQNTAGAMNLDTGHLKPDFSCLQPIEGQSSGLDANLQHVFNDMSTQDFSVATQSLESRFDVPSGVDAPSGLDQSFSVAADPVVPDVSVPSVEISVPDVSFSDYSSSIDTSSSFDSGSSSSFDP